MESLSGIIDYQILLVIILWTIFLSLFVLRKISDIRVSILFVFLMVSIFFYSGYGISYIEVNNKYVLNYIVFTLSFALPFLLIKIKSSPNQLNSLDLYFSTHRSFLAKCSYIYLLCAFIPIVYPEFRLFEIFTTGFKGLIGFYDLRVQYRSNAIIGVVDSIKAFLRPLFLVYLTILQVKNPKSKKPLLLFLLMILFSYMRYAYLSRYQIVIFALQIFVIAYCAKGYNLVIRFRHIFMLLLGFVASIPFLYAFTFIRQGNVYQWGNSFLEITQLLINSETYYPIFYDRIIQSPYLSNQTPSTFILWLIFLPIPSFLWPGKPSLSSDAFTYAMTGLHYGDEGYSSSLPSLLGESLMFFGPDFYWVQALIMGFVIIFLIKYLFSFKSTNFMTMYLIVYILVIGRGGAGSYMSIIVLSVFTIFLFQKFLSKLLK